MKKSFYLLIVSFAVLFSYTNAFAQIEGMTEYEQKREQLVTEAMEKIMNTMSAYDKAAFSVGLMKALKEAHDEGDRYQEMTISENILFKLCELGEVFQTEANLLAKSININDIYAGNTLQEWKTIGEWYKQERVNLDKTKTPEDVQREKDRAEQMRVLTGIPGVKQRVKKEFLNWAKKGEYEKTIAYNERLSREGTAVFDSLCFVHFNKMFASSVRMETRSEYDADREGIDTRFYQLNDKGEETSSVSSFWPINIEQAKSITRSDKWDRNREYANGLFFKNGDCYPAIWHMMLGRYEWDFVLGTPESCIISMDDVLKGSSITNTGHSFDYSDYSSGMLTDRQLKEKIWDFFQKKNNDYLEIGPWGDYPGAGKRYGEIFHKGKFLFTNKQVEKLLQRIQDEEAAKIEAEKTRVRINAIINDIPLLSQKDEVIRFVEDYNRIQRGEMLARNINEVYGSELALYKDPNNGFHHVC